MRERDAVLAANALAAVNTANALRAFDRRGRLSDLSFAAGWLTSELPLQTLGALLALDGLAAARGDLRGRRGAGSVLLAAASAAGLVAAHRIARRAPELFEAALVEALGPDYRDEIVQPRFPGPGAATARTPGVVRMMRIRRRFAHHTDICYGPEGRANLLDVWSRQDLPRDGRAPVLLQMPGGAWVMGNKQAQAYPLMSHLAEQGWVCVAINYRLAPRHPWPAQIVDVKRAIAWVKAHIAEYGGDPSFVAVTGGSAGGHLSSLAALTPGDKQWQPGFEDADTTVQACVPFYGEYDWTDRHGVGNHGLLPLLERRVVQTSYRTDPDVFDAASPMSRVSEHAPPFFVSHGVQDSLIPVEQARLFVAMLREISREPVGYAELPGAQHAYDIFGSARGNAAAVAVARFLGVVYGRHLRAAGAAA